MVRDVTSGEVDRGEEAKGVVSRRKKLLQQRQESGRNGGLRTSPITFARADAASSFSCPRVSSASFRAIACCQSKPAASSACERRLARSARQSSASVSSREW
nr:hypothetical protein CFP56_19282 [Quercus suber]